MVDPVAMLLHRSDWPGDHPHSYGPCPAQHSGSTPHASNEPTCATSQTEACGQSMSSSTLPATSIVASCIPKKQLSFLGNSCDKTNYFSRLAHPRECLKCRSQNRTPGTRFVVNTWTSFPSPHRKTWKRRIFLSSFISLLVFASQLSGVSSTSPSPSSSNTDLNLGILVAESTDEDFLSKLQTRVDKAVSDFYNSAEYQDLNPGSSGQDFRVSCSIYQQRDTESVVSNLNNIFSNTTTNAVLSLASYDIHSSFLPLAELYQKAYIPVNAFLPPEAKTHILSLLPTFRQQAQMLSKILDLYKWQTVHVIYSKFHFWQEFSTYFYFDMSSMLFKVTLSRALESPLQTQEADDALDEAKTSKVVVLFLDIDDQLTILARASAKEMTKHHIFFSFPRTPYDPTSLSLLALTPPITGQGRFSADATTQGINIFESVFVVTPTFPPEATVSSANSTDTQSGSRRRRRRRRRRSTEAAGGGTPLYFASGRESHNVVMNKHHGGGDGRRENRLVGKGQVGQGALQTLTYRQRKKDPHFDFPPENSETVSKDSGEKSYKNRDKNCSGENGGKNRNIFLPDITYKTLPSSPMFDRPRSPIRVGKDVEYVVQSDTQAISSINQALSPGVYVPTKRSSENKPFPFAQARNRRPLFEDVKHQIPQFVKGGSSGAVKQSEDSSTLDTSRDKVSHTGSSPQRPNTLLFESEDSSHSVLDTDILEKDKDEPSSPSSSKLRYKREIQKFVASGSDLSAIYDAVYLVSLAALRVASNSSSVPSGEQLIRSVYDQTFPGDLGQFTIDQQQAVLFDFVLYDFNSSSGTFHPRVFYEAVSSSDWLLTEQGAISWPGTIVPGDECYKQMPNCNEGVEISYIIAIVIAAIGIIVIAAVVIVFIRRYWVNKEMTKGPNKVILNSEDLVFILRKDMGKGSRIMKSRATLIDKDNTPDLLRGSADPSRSMASINELSDYTETARYNGDLVHVKELDIKGFEMRSKLLTFVRMIVKKLKKPPPLIRPSVTPQAAPPQFIQIMKQCWSEMPEMRPSVDDVYDQFKKLTGGK
ncbi:uncharacterized protein LOC101858123 [Aplysia californica]|uniref:Uncharacterized protein LOC101858123 n=1 Tax=Aplysia californica TaxID=6500 RepID=A0ABM0JYY1_APLCA|nr:uncharacterized protein LOC101858123 [Aplysia californica]